MLFRHFTFTSKSPSSSSGVMSTTAGTKEEVKKKKKKKRTVQVIIQMVRHYIRGTLVKLIMSFHYNSQIQIYRNASST